MPVDDSRPALCDLIGHIPLFAGLWDRGLEWVAATLVERRFAAGEIIFEEGAPGCSLFVVKSGGLVAVQGRARLMRFGPGDFFGEATLIEMQPRPFTARVEQDAVLYELTNRDLYRLYQEDLKAYVLVLQNINRALCDRLRRASLRITEQEQAAVPQR